MKAKLEDILVQNRGVELESETEEEKAILELDVPIVLSGQHCGPPRMRMKRRKHNV